MLDLTESFLLRKPRRGFEFQSESFLSEQWQPEPEELGSKETLKLYKLSSVLEDLLCLAPVITGRLKQSRWPKNGVSGEDPHPEVFSGELCRLLRLGKPRVR